MLSGGKMKICPVCHGGEINNKNCRRCGGSGFISSTDKRKKSKRKVVELVPLPKVGLSIKPSARKSNKKKKAEKDVVVDGEIYSKRERIKEKDEAAWVVRVNE